MRLTTERLSGFGSIYAAMSVINRLLVFVLAAIEVFVLLCTSAVMS